MQKNQLVQIEEEEEESILFMIVSSNGGSLYSKSFEHQQTANENLIASFLSAMDSFSKQSLATDQSLNRVIVGDYTIALEQAYISLIVMSSKVLHIRQLRKCKG